MSKLIKRGKIALVVSLTISTVIWSIGLAAFTPAVFAAGAGDLIKQEGSASVYYLGSNNKRYTFANRSTFESWYGSSATVTTVSSETLLGYELGGNAVARAGRLVQVVSNDTPWKVADAKVYALSTNGTIRAIDSAETAVALFGAKWESRIIPIPEQLFSNYTVGAALTSSSVLPNGFLVTDGADTYLIDGGAKRAVSAEGFTANKFKESDKITKTSLTAYTDGSAVSGVETGLFNVAGGATTPVTPVVGGGVTVGLAANTPVADNVPVNAPRVNFLKFTLTASSEADVTVNTLVLNNTGLGAASTISDVYLYEGNTRLSTGKSVNATTKDATFNNLGLVIPAGTTKTIDVKATITAASAIHGFSIVSASSVTTSGATVSGTFPVTGNLMSSVTVADLGAVTIAKAGTTSYARKIGSKDVEVGKFTLAITQENATFKGITIYNSGNDIYDNMKLYRGSALLGTATESGKYFVFNFATPDALLKTDGTVSYTLKADIASDNTNDAGALYMRYSTDIDITGNNYGYGLAVTFTAYDGGAAAEQNATTLEAGAVTIAFNGPATSNISVNTTDVTLLDFSIYAQSATKIEKDTFVITLTNSDGDAAVTLANTIDNLELVCDGAVIADYTVGVTPATETNTDEWEIAAGQTRKCILRADTLTTADSGDTIAAAITTPGISTVWTIKDSGTDTTVSSVVPSATITGNTLSIISAGLTVTAASTPANKTWVKGATAEAVGFNFAASDSNAVTVTGIVVSAGLDKDITNGLGIVETYLSDAEDVIDSVSLWDGDTQVGETEGLTVGSATNSNITATFDNLSWVVPKGTTKKLTLKAKISTNAPFGGNSDYVAFSIAIGGVTAEYGTGTTLTGVPSAAVNAGAAPAYYQTVSGAGALSADIPTNTPASTIAVAGSTSVPFTKIKFTATNEDIIISKLALKNASSAYDDDISAVKVTYPTNGTQTTTETKTCTLASGIATCTGLNIFVPNPNTLGYKNYVVVDVIADMQTVVGGADAADAPAFTLSLAGTFEALGKDSNTVIAQQTLSVADLASNRNNAVETEALIAAAATTGTTLTIDNGAGAAITAGEIAAGDVLCITLDDASDCATDGDELVYVTAATTTALTVVRGYAGSTIADIANNEYIYLVHTGSDRATTSPVQISTAGTVMDIDGAVSGATTTSLTVAGASALTTLGIGDVVCITPNGGTACVAGDEHLYISAVGSATGITVIRGWDGTTAAAIANDEEILLIRKNNGVLDTNAMNVQGTKLTIAAASHTKGGQNSTAEVMKFTASAAAQGDAKIRQGMTLTTATEGTDTTNRSGVADNTTYDLDGSSMAVTWTGDGVDVDDTIQFAATAGTLDDYARVSFWVYWYDAVGSTALAMTDLTAFTSTNATVASGQGTALTGTCTEGAWCHVDIAVPTGTDASDVVFGIQLKETTLAGGAVAAINDVLAIDDVKFYNEKIQVDMTLNEDVTIPAAGNTSYLLQNGTIVATGTAGWDITGSDNETGSIVFVPTGTYADIEISGSDTFTIQTATNIFTESGTSTEILALTIDLGNSGAPGDIYWYDDEGSSIVSYTGVNATDKITATNSY